MALPLRMNTVKRITWKTEPIWRSDVIFRFRCYYTVILSFHFVTLYNVILVRHEMYIYVIYISIYLYSYLFISIFLSIYLSIYLSIDRSIYLRIYCKMYAMEAMTPFVVMNATAWKVKVANMFVMLIIWCKIQEKNYCKLQFIWENESN